MAPTLDAVLELPEQVTAEGYRRVSHRRGLLKAHPNVWDLWFTTFSMDSSLAFLDDEMQRVLFSTSPVLGELPVFKPIEDSWTQLLDSDSDNDDDDDDGNFTLGDVHHLLQTGTNPRDLQAHLAEAAQSTQEDVVQMLLSAGVPVSLRAVKAAIVKESIPLLSLFLNNGWSINEEEAWCIPPLLSCCEH